MFWGWFFLVFLNQTITQQITNKNVQLKIVDRIIVFKKFLW